MSDQELFELYEQARDRAAKIDVKTMDFFRSELLVRILVTFDTYGKITKKQIVDLIKKAEKSNCGETSQAAKKKCPFNHELHQDKDAACPVCGEVLNPDF